MIPLVHPIVGADEKKILNQIVDSRILASGAYVSRFENRCAQLFGTKYAVAVSSGTTALHAALLACGIKAGDKVLTTPFSFIATANSILFCGAKPIFADIDPHTCNLSPVAAEAALKREKNVKAVILVHLYGRAADMGAFKRLKKKYGFVLIEDCAQAHGATFGGQTVGSFGDASAFSFYATKNVMCGEGGTVQTNYVRIDRLARQIINHGRAGHSTHAILGYNFRLTNLAAGIGIVQLNKLENWTAARIRNARYLNNEFAGLGYVITPVPPENGTAVYHQYTVRVPQKVRKAFMRHLQKRGVGCGVYYPYAIYRQPLYRDLGFRSGICPEAERASREVVSLPVHPALTRKDLETIADAVKSFRA
jgi:dTDP-4-amino-4,6-dideoxygalactose transaminase